jgi:hypothetical protein
LSLGVESAENPYSGAMNTVQWKTLHIRGETLLFGIPINARQPVITPDALSRLIK